MVDSIPDCSVDDFRTPHELFSICRGRMVARTQISDKVKILASCMFCSRYEHVRSHLQENPLILSNLTSMFEPDDRSRVTIFFDNANAEIDMDRHIGSLCDIFHILRLYRMQDAKCLTSLTLDSRIIDNMNLFYEIPLVFPNIEIFSVQNCNLSYHCLEPICHLIRECKNLKGVWIDDNLSLLSALRHAQRSDSHLFAGAIAVVGGVIVQTEIDVITDLNPSIEIVGNVLTTCYKSWGLKHFCTHNDDEEEHVMTLNLCDRGISELKLSEFQLLSSLHQIIINDLDISQNKLIHFENLANLLLILPHLSVLWVDESLSSDGNDLETLFYLCPSLEVIEVMDGTTLVRTIDNKEPVHNPLPVDVCRDDKLSEKVNIVMQRLFDFALPMRWSDQPNQYHSLYWCIPEPFVAYMIRHDPINPTLDWAIVMQTMEDDGKRRCCFLLWPKRVIEDGEDITMDWLASPTVNGSTSMNWLDVARLAASNEIYLPLDSVPFNFPKRFPAIDSYDDSDDGERKQSASPLIFPLDGLSCKRKNIKAISDLPEMDEYFRSDDFRALICDQDSNIHASSDVVLSWTAEFCKFQLDSYIFSNHACLAEMDNKASWTRSIRCKSISVAWLPRTFLLPYEILELIRHHDSHPRQRYIIKSAGGNRGWEVHVTSNFSCVLRFAFQVYLIKDVSSLVDACSCVVSEYISSPLVYMLDDGNRAYKIDFRYFVLVKRSESGSFNCFLYSDFLVRTGFAPIAQIKGNEVKIAEDDDLLAHVTNTFLTPLDEAANRVYLTSKQFVDYFNQGRVIKPLCRFGNDGKTSDDQLDWNADVMPRIKACISECMSYSCKISDRPNQLSSLIGVDVLVGCKCNELKCVELQPYILELNLSPSLQRAVKEFGKIFTEHVIFNSFSSENRYGDVWTKL